MKQRMILTVMLSVGVLAMGAAQLSQAADHELVGARKCKICHGKKTGNQWTIWSESAHAGAFETLASEQAKKIAADKGLGDPQKESECLKCHASRGFLGCEEVSVSAKGKYASA